jgi:plasmid replication initiation protein
MTTELLPAVKPTDERWVSMSNNIARAAHGLDLSEKRLIALGLAKTDSKDSKLLISAMTQGWKVKINAVEYAEVFGLERNTAYEQVISASDDLFRREVRFEDKGKGGKAVTKKFRWVSGAVYQPGEGYVELNFTPEIAPHLLGLRSKFTMMRLQQAAPFSSVYTWRMFELLKSWESEGTFTINIADFWEAVEAAASARKDFTQLRLRVIEPTVSEIMAMTKYTVEWEPMRTGARKVTALKFSFYENPQQDLI